MSGRRALLGAAVVAVLLAVAAVMFGGHDQPRATVEQPAQTLPGGTAVPATPGAPTSSSSGASSSSSDTTVEGEAADPAHEDLDEAMPSPTPAPAFWGTAEADRATQAARAALEAFSRPSGPDVDAQAWWGRLEPTLSVAAAQIYERVDPRLVPYTQVLQVDAAQRAGSDLVATVTASTDAGPYDVLLARVDGASPWLVEQLRPQEQP